METKLNVGLFGFGCVGQGLHDIASSSEVLKADLKKVCVKNVNKKRKIKADYFTQDAGEILSREDVNVVVELINDADEAYDIVSSALVNGQHVVTANKKLIAEKFPQLYDLHLQFGGSILYEGAVAGSIPVIRNLEEYYNNELLTNLRGIINGSSNYILSKMEEGLCYGSALKKAQDEGFAELDPWLDVAGYDAKYKLIILGIHAFGIILKPEKVLNIGIQNINSFDINYAKENGFRIKLIASACKTSNGFKFQVIPTFVSENSLLYDINYEQNAIEIEGAFEDKQFLVGKGAGSHPTGSAVVSDLSALSNSYSYGYKKLKKNLKNLEIDFSALQSTNYFLKLYIRYNNPETLDKIGIHRIHQQHSSNEFNYIIADVPYASLFALMDKDVEDIFVAQMD